MPRRKVAVLFERLGPYHVARLQACGSYFEPVAVEFYGRDSTYAWDPVGGANGFARLTVLPVQVPDVRGVIDGVSAALDSISPEVVAVPGWSHPGALAAIRWCARSAVPFVLMADSFETERRGKAVRRWVKRRVVKMAGAALVAGTVHRGFIATLGMKENQIFTGYDVVDNRHFARRTVGEDPGGSAEPYFLDGLQVHPREEPRVPPRGIRRIRVCQSRVAHPSRHRRRRAGAKRCWRHGFARFPWNDWCASPVSGSTMTFPPSTRAPGRSSSRALSSRGDSW